MSRINTLILLSALLVVTGGAFSQNLLVQPESVVYDAPRSRYLVSNWANGDIIAVDHDGRQSLFSPLLMHTSGLHIVGDTVYAASYGGTLAGLIGFDLNTAEIIVDLELPAQQLLNDITSDTSGFLYVTDFWAHRVYKVSRTDFSSSVFAYQGLRGPNGIMFDSLNNRLLLLNENASGGPVVELNLFDSTMTNLVETNLARCDGIAQDNFNNIYISDLTTERVYRYEPDFTPPPVIASQNHDGPADIDFNKLHCILAVPNFDDHTLDLIEKLIYGETDVSQGRIPFEVSFTGTADVDMVSWAWDFGDGDSSFVQSPTHTYDEPGLYSVMLQGISTDGVQLHRPMHKVIAALADTMIAARTETDPTSTVMVEIYANNNVPIDKIYIPFQYSGDLDLTFDSFSTDGLRTSFFASQQMLHRDDDGRQATLRLTASDDGEYPLLDAGTGPVAKLYFSAGIASVGDSTEIVLDGYGDYVPMFSGPYAEYVPVVRAGMAVCVGCCIKRGDLDHNDAIMITDLTYLSEYMFAGGAPAVCAEEGDLNGSGQTDISDLTYFADFMFGGGPAPLPCSQ